MICSAYRSPVSRARSVACPAADLTAPRSAEKKPSSARACKTASRPDGYARPRLAAAASASPSRRRAAARSPAMFAATAAMGSVSDNSSR